MHETIIEGRRLEKFYGDPGENVIQVIAPTDISVRARSSPLWDRPAPANPHCCGC